MNIYQRYRKLNFWNKFFVIAGFASIIGVILYFIPSDKISIKSKNQSGGITAQKVENNYYNTTVTDDNLESLKRDANLAIIYRDELSHFFLKFKTCLYWSIPLKDQMNNEFGYSNNPTDHIFERLKMTDISRDLLIKIFNQYDFTAKMINYEGTANGMTPTGYRNILGILKYLNAQIESHLEKYGGSVSTDLSIKLEYMNRTINNNISNIKEDMLINKSISIQTKESLADLIVLIIKDHQIMVDDYLQNSSGGYPIKVGRMQKSPETNGSLTIQTEFSDY